MTWARAKVTYSRVNIKMHTSANQRHQQSKGRYWLSSLDTFWPFSPTSSGKSFKGMFRVDFSLSCSWSRP